MNRKLIPTNVRGKNNDLHYLLLDCAKKRRLVEQKRIAAEWYEAKLLKY